MKREHYLNKILKYFKTHNVVALLGPRQCGKTTLANMFLDKLKLKGEELHYFDLEDPTDLARLDNVKLTLENLTGIIIIDEIQRRPDLFPILRVLIDRNKAKQKYLILGSASRDLLQQSSETLAGRIAYIELTPFAYFETNEIEKLWLRGGYPNSYLSESDDDSYLWREEYISTFLERDIPALGINIAPMQLRRFWSMLTHFHGNIINYSELGRSFGISDTTIRSYIEILHATFMIRTLQPWFENIKKRQVKSPKIYFRDSGILHNFLETKNKLALEKNYKLGASWEGFAIEEIIRINEAKQHQCFFWSTYSGAELDLLIVKEGKKLALEIKYNDAPNLTTSMRIVEQDLKPDEFIVIYPGSKDYKLSENIKVMGLKSYLDEVAG